MAAAITVAASNANDRMAWFSDYGACVDLWAPGDGIRSDWPDGTTKVGSGTSIAAPHVAGAVARYLEVAPNASPAAAANFISNTATLGIVQNVPAGTTKRLLFAQGMSALFVVGAPALITPDDAAVRDRLFALGYAVNVHDGYEATADHAAGKSLILISNSAGDLDVLDKFQAVAVPAIVYKAALFPDMKMTTEYDRGTTAGQSDLRITMPSHAIADGLNGTIDTLQGAASASFTWAFRAATLRSSPG